MALFDVDVDVVSLVDRFMWALGVDKTRGHQRKRRSTSQFIVNLHPMSVDLCQWCWLYWHWLEPGVFTEVLASWIMVRGKRKKQRTWNWPLPAHEKPCMHR